MLGANLELRDLVIAAAERAGVISQAVAAAKNAETAKEKGRASGRPTPSRPTVRPAAAALVLNSGQDLVWPDNNYATMSGQALYFGLYWPRRVQFVYRSGRLQANDGPWVGRSEPERYFVPTPESERGPCFNVAKFPECLAERAREDAAASATR